MIFEVYLKDSGTEDYIEVSADEFSVDGELIYFKKGISLVGVFRLDRINGLCKQEG